MNKPVMPVSSLSLKLPTADRSVETYRLAASRTYPAKLEGTLNRVAFSAAHVVSDPLADVDLSHGPARSALAEALRSDATPPSSCRQQRRAGPRRPDRTRETATREPVQSSDAWSVPHPIHLYANGISHLRKAG